MKKIVDRADTSLDNATWSCLEQKYNILIRPEIKEFIKQNSGGNPIHSMIDTQSGLREIRKILSATKNNKYYSIEKYADQFLSDTKGKIIPVAVDSAGNYFCVNNDTGKVYFWFEEDGLYYPVADNLEQFENMF